MPYTARQTGKIGLTQADVVANRSSLVNVNKIVQGAKSGAKRRIAEDAQLQNQVTQIKKSGIEVSNLREKLDLDKQIAKQQIENYKQQTLTQGIVADKAGVELANLPEKLALDKKISKEQLANDTAKRKYNEARLLALQTEQERVTSEVAVKTQALQAKVEIVNLQNNLRTAEVQATIFNGNQEWRTVGESKLTAAFNHFNALNVGGTNDTGSTRTEEPLFAAVDNALAVTKGTNNTFLTDTSKAQLATIASQLHEKGLFSQYIQKSLEKGNSIPISWLSQEQLFKQQQREKTEQVSTLAYGENWVATSKQWGFRESSINGIKEEITSIINTNGITTKDGNITSEVLATLQEKSIGDYTKVKKGVQLLAQARINSQISASVISPQEGTFYSVVAKTSLENQQGAELLLNMENKARTGDTTTIDATSDSFIYYTDVTKNAVEELQKIVSATKLDTTDAAKVNVLLDRLDYLKENNRAYSFIAANHGTNIASQEFDPLLNIAGFIGIFNEVVFGMFGRSERDILAMKQVAVTLGKGIGSSFINDLAKPEVMVPYLQQLLEDAGVSKPNADIYLQSLGAINEVSELATPSGQQSNPPITISAPPNTDSLNLGN